MAELVNLQVSNLCLPPRDIALGGVDEHVKFLAAVNRNATALEIEGYDAGYEITPTRALMHSITWNSLLRKFNGSYYRDTQEGMKLSPIWTSSHAAWAHFDSPYALPLQTEGESFKSMRRLDPTYDSLPKVVFADSRTRDGKLRNYKEQGLTNAVAQMSPEVFDAWSVTLPGDYAKIKDQMDELHITEIVADPFHVERSHRYAPNFRIDTPRLLDAIDAQGIPVRRAHLALARTDFPNKQDVAQSVDNLKALIDSPEKFAETQAGKFLGQCFDIWLDRHETDERNGTDEWGQSFTVTTEITEAGFRAVKGHNAQFDGIGLPEKHAYVILQTRKFFDSVVQYGPQS